MRFFFLPELSHRITRSRALPVNWVKIRLEDIAEINPKTLNRTTSLHESKVSFVPMRCVQEENGFMDLSLQKFYNEVKKGYTPFIDGDILFAKITPCMENGKIAIAENLLNGVGFGSTEFHVIRLINEHLHKKYFYYYFLQRSFREMARRNMKGTAGQLRVPMQFLKDVQIPLPPSNEQRRISSKLDELFTNLDAGVEYLKRIQILLNQYRQSVLKYAFEGKLTEDWREVHKDEIEPASKFLDTINGNIIINNSFFIPYDWALTNIGSITNNFDGKRVPIKSSDRARIKGQYPYYGAAGIIDYVNDYLFDGEFLLVGEDGANLLSRSKPNAFLAKGKFWVNNHAHVLQMKGGMSLSYLQHYINSMDLRFHITGSAQPKLTQLSMNRLVIPIAPYSEQSVIIEQIEKHMSIIENTNKIVQTSLKQIDGLRRSILKNAFEGKLIPQDPKDEPAEFLLKKIKKERELIDSCNDGRSKRIKTKFSVGIQTRLM